ncbi:uncharacterized protein Z520_06280 [Fonsecaea multimorphosa CBS 102226]|uniref:Uncharacterized protein n=1 Tax=Fonsecaea multimorphosa CBS 102226 TaxID=1442371 RepID=A0A0D2H8L3_9EURO|nr:uncharacterized protein Z520_06280 [Fonsecaea multimorphosa CBS 102226]KIX98200.1 hypothetical protein Z520_06280 [Fonsecaea multimorphosa CBS 102226]OAL22663.1 hypothetical protein AYO22_07222 [Fonsecaea multimorphosa]
MRPLESRLSTNVFLHVPLQQSSSSSVREAKRTLQVVFFIPGNPGLIGYYHPFLALVVRGVLRGEENVGGRGRGHGREKERGFGDAGRKEDENGDGGEGWAQQTVVVAGFSLGGFDVGDESSPKSKEREEERAEEEEDLLYPPSFLSQSRHKQRQKQQENHGNLGDRKGKGTAAEGQQHHRMIYTLREQIELSYARVQYLVERLQEGQKANISEQEQEPLQVEVVLMGHSVGAYIALEIVRLWHERHPQPMLDPSDTTTADSHDRDDDTSRISSLGPSETRDGRSPSWSISTCILLTPTIQDIHLSPSGRLATPLLSYLPFLPGLAHMLLHAILLRLTPPAWFCLLVSRVTGMQVGSHGYETTMAFLRSGRGVKQALFMAQGEMREIRRDVWGREVWGASHHNDVMTAEEDDRSKSTTSSPRLFFWFAKKDHWIANITKEAIVKSRAADVGVQRDSFTGSPTNLAVVETEEVVFMPDQMGQTTARAARIHILETEAMVHAWCLDQSEFVARRVSSWLREVLHADNSMLRDGRSLNR